MDIRKHGSKSNTVRFILKRADTGLGITGLTFNSGGLIISTICDNEASPTVYTQAAGNIEDISTLGTFAAPTSAKCRFKEVHSTNHKGLYEFQFADARFAVAAAKKMVISVSGASNLADGDYEIALTEAGLEDVQTLRTGILAGGSVSGAVLDEGASTTNDQYRNYGIRVTHAATGLKEFRAIPSYTGSSRTCAFDRDMLEACASGDAFEIVAGASAAVSGTLDANMTQVGGSTADRQQFAKGLKQILTGMVTNAFHTPTDTVFEATGLPTLGNMANLNKREIYWGPTTGLNHHKARILSITDQGSGRYRITVYSQMPQAPANGDTFEVLG